ncbi:MAG TPA: hypothetical protein VIP11_22505 [Gemmatimonadaceae bacterium]
MLRRFTFLDLKERNDQERQRLLNRRFLLERRKEDDKRLEPELEAELRDIVRKTTRQNPEDDTSPYVVSVVDPLFIETRRVLGQSVRSVANVADHIDGVFPGELGQDERMLAAVYGLISADNFTTPEGERFARAVSSALGEYTGSQRLFDAVLEILGSEGGEAHAVNTDQWAGVTRALRADGVTEKNEHLRLLALDALSNQVGSGDAATPSSVEIILPDLDEGTDIEIVVANVKAMQALYYAAMLDEVKFFAVTDKLVEQFQNGMLPLGRGPAGDGLYKYWKKSVDRISEPERRNLYARAFGFPGGDAVSVVPNRSFPDLWLRFVSAVSSYVRQITVDDLLRSTVPLAVSAEQVRKAGRDLAANLSLHGYGIAYFAATELQGQIKEVIALLNDPEIKNAYGARDMWQVIEQVSIYELGGAKNTVRYRTMATAGAIIIRWLANRAQLLTGSSFSSSILSLDEIRRPSLRPRGVRATENPTDRDLVDACEQWLAVTGTPDQRVEEYSQPSEAPATTSRPVQIPQAARDLLESVGVQASYTPSVANGRLSRR